MGRPVDVARNAVTAIREQPLEPKPTLPKALGATLVVVFGFAAVFGIPYLFPPSDGLSVSYAFGFGNRACEVTLVLFLALFAWMYRGFGLRPPAESAEPIATRSYKWLAITSALSIVGCVAVWVATRDTAPFAEAHYFLDRLEMYRLGGTLYRSFEFDYGPLLFLPAVWLARLLHLSLGDGYYLFWTSQWVLGVAALWLLVQWLPAKPAARTPVFLLFWALLMLSFVDGGASYTPLRFVSAPLLAVAVYRLYHSATRMLVVFAVAASGSALLLLYSPEQAAVFVAGSLLFFTLCVPARRPGTFAMLAGLVAWAAGLVAVAYRSGELDTLIHVGNGAVNFPLLPSFQVCAELLLLLAAACLVRNALADRTSHGVFLYVAALSLTCIPAAFGRCDPGHIYVNLLGLYLVTVLALFPRTPRLAWASGGLCGLFLLSQYAYHALPAANFMVQARVLVDQDPSLRTSATRSLTAARFGGRANQPAAGEGLGSPQGRMLAASDRLFAPFGVYRRATPIPGPQVITGFYPWFVGKTSTGVAAEKIQEIERWNLPLLAPDEPGCDAPAAELYAEPQSVLHPWFMPRLKHVPETGKPLCDYILAHYRMDEGIAPVRGMRVWERVR
jgi:hypothetical protein